MNSKKVLFLKMVSRLIDHAQFMQISTRYSADKFNYDYANIQFQEHVKAHCTKEEIKEIFPRGLH